MGHAIWLPKPPPRGCIAQARNPDGPKPDTRTHEGRRHSFDVDVRDHLIVERDAQAASAALLEGGKEDAEQEQRAGCCAEHALITFQLTIARHHACQFGGHSPAVRTRTHARTQTLVHRARLSVRENGAPWHLPPLPCAQSARL